MYTISYFTFLTINLGNINFFETIYCSKKYQKLYEILMNKIFYINLKIIKKTDFFLPKILLLEIFEE